MFEEIGGVQVRGIEESASITDPYSMFLFALRSPKTREKSTGRLRMFFDFIGIPGDSMAERSKVFCDRAKNNDNDNNSSGWAFSNIIQYMQHQKERAERKEITAGTVKNYFQVITKCQIFLFHGKGLVEAFQKAGNLQMIERLQLKKLVKY